MIKSKEIVSRGIDARARVPLEYLPLATVFVCLFVWLFVLFMRPATRDYHLLLAIKKINREHWLILTFLGGDKDEGDADHMESLSRPVSGERTSSHDDNESVGSVRPASGASGSITGK